MEWGVAVDRGLAGWWASEAPPLEISKEAPLEVDAESLLELEEDWERMGGGSCGWEGRFQLWNRSRSWLMASSWSSIAAEGVSFRALERK